MQTKISIRRRPGGWVWLLLLWVLPGSLVAAFDRVVIVKSNDNAYFDQTVQTLINRVDKQMRFRLVLAEALGDLQADRGERDLFIALGQLAVDAIARSFPEAEVINAYLTLEQYHRLDPTRSQTTIVLDQPLQRYLVFSKLILHPDSIGIISDAIVEIDPGLTRLLERNQLRLRQYRVDPENKLLPVLRRLLQQDDALLMLPRQAIYNRDTLKGVLLTSYRSRKPVISYSPAHVKSGALASVYSSPVDIGRHLAYIVNRRLDGKDRGGTGLQHARYYSIATNPGVARALSLDLPTDAELRAGLDRVNR